MMAQDKTMDNQYTYRDTIIVTVADLIEKNFLHPELIRLSLPESNKKFPLDVGCIAYSKRRYYVEKGNCLDVPFQVILNSFQMHRRKLIYKILEYIVIKGFNQNSIAGFIGKVRMAMNTIDDYGYNDFLVNETITRDIYDKISNSIKHKVHTNEITPRKAQLIQSDLRIIILIYFGKPVADFIAANSVRFSGRVNKTKPREIEELKIAYNVYLRLANQFGAIVMEEKPMPFLLDMPEYKTYIFPYATHRVTPYCDRPTEVYNEIEGRLVTQEEYHKKRPDKPIGELNNNLKRSTLILDEANENPRSKCRRALACTAMQAYQIIFMMLTGSYASEIAQIEFNESFESSKSIEHKSYRAVKFRASGRIIQYDLAAGSVALFRRYLKLRHWVLNGRSFPYLFFGLGTKSWDPVTVNESALRSFQRKKILGVFMPNDFEMLTAREFRKTKSIFLHEQMDVSKETVAKVMNHSDLTNELYYMEVLPETAKNQLSNFWDAAHEAAKHIKYIENNNNIKIAAGHCDNFKSPESVIPSPPITPNCNSQYGCLFCKHYVCHANDEDDIHKLFSLLYIINGVMNGVSDTDKAKSVFLMLSARVRYILNEIKLKSKTGCRLIDNIRDRVLKYGELTPYWESRLQRYEALGLVFMEKKEDYDL